MRNVVFVAPFFLATTIRFLESVLSLENVRVGLVSQDPIHKLPGNLRGRLAADWRVADALDANHLVPAVQGLATKLGGVERLVGALEELQVPLAQVRERLHIPGLSVEAAQNFRDKSRMKTVLQENGLPCAKHALARSADEARKLIDDLGFPVIAKPPDGAGARGTYKLEDANAFQEFVQHFPISERRPVLFEEFIQGEEHSFDSVMVDGQPVWYSISDYSPGPLAVLQNAWIQWTVLLPRELEHPRYDAIREAAAKALRVLGLKTGLTHMEWFQRPDGSIAISEVGARPPGAQFSTLISYAHNRSLYRSWAQLMVFDTFDPPSRPYAAGAAYLRGMGRGRVKAVHGLGEAQAELGDLVVEAKIPKPGQPASGTYEGEGYVILRHPETERVAHGLKRLVELIRVELSEV